MFISLFEKIDFVGVYSIYYATFLRLLGQSYALLFGLKVLYFPNFDSFLTIVLQTLVLFNFLFKLYRLW